MRNVRTVFRGKLLKVMVKKTKLPNGYVTDLEVVEHRGASLIVPFLNKDKVILVKQFRPVINSYIYELPAGTIDEKEAPLACARREILEETGFSARRFTLLGKIYPVPGYSTEKIIIYKAERLKKETRFVQKDEVMENRVFDRSGIRRLFRAGRIVDAKTICALALCGWL